jgi:vancomycin resistance protein YoaR
MPHDLPDAPASRPGRALLAAGAVLVLGGAAAAAFGAFGSRGEAAAAARPAVAAPVAPAASGVGLRPAVRAAVDRLLASPVTLTFDGKSVTSSWSELGATIDEAGVERAAARLDEDDVGGLFVDGKGGPAPVALDRARALEVLVGMKDSHDRPAVDARVDLVSKKVVPEAPGFGIDVYGSLATLAEAARAGRGEVALAGGPIEAAVTVAKLGNLDIGHVLGWFETRYPPGEKDRNYNLRLVAEHVNGHIIMPGETFSFNGVVGDRTEKEGYRVAHVIQAGEMIDGLAGGACQISSTLHGASWFAGLEMINSRPHSRPSTYIPMALDATVVYPSVDLVMRNPYDFPVVIHYTVSQGTVRVEILGRERPWDKVAFEREIKEEKPNETVTREDPALPLGTSVVDQVGFPGYKLERRRIFYKDGKPAKTERWAVAYPPTTEYIRIGTNPDPNLVPPREGSHHGPQAPGGRTFRLER